MRLDGDGIERTTTAIHYFNCLKIKYSQKSFPGDVITASGSITIDGINAEDGVDPFTDIPTLKRPHEQARRIPATFRKVHENLPKELISRTDKRKVQRKGHGISIAQAMVALKARYSQTKDDIPDPLAHESDDHEDSLELADTDFEGEEDHDDDYNAETYFQDGEQDPDEAAGGQAPDDIESTF